MTTIWHSDHYFACFVLYLGGTVKMGRDHHGQDLYGWDNEFGSEIKVEF